MASCTSCSVSGRLVADGLVRRRSCADDRRVSYAELTEEGLRAVKRATEVHLVSLQKHFVEPLGEDGLAALAAAARRLRDALVPQTDAR